MMRELEARQVVEGSKWLPVSVNSGLPEDNWNNAGPLVGYDTFHPPASLLGIIPGPAHHLPWLPAGDQKKKPCQEFLSKLFFFPSSTGPVLELFKEEVLFPHSKLSRLFLPLVVKVEAAAQAISGVCDVCFFPSAAEPRAGRLSPELSLGISLADIKMINLAALMFSSSPPAPR